MAAMLRAPFRVAALSHCKDLLSITWQDGAQSKFPNVWLRGAVRDPVVFDASTLNYKRDDYVDFIPKESPLVRAEHEKDSEDVLVEWGDHLGTFNASWLRAQDSSINQGLTKKPDITLWDANFELPTYEYSERKAKFHSWFSDLKKYGVAVFQGVPPNEQGILSIIHSIGQEAQRSHPTNILRILTDDTKEKNYDTATYTSKAHPMHVDTPYYATMHRLTCLLGILYDAPVQDTYNYLTDNLKVIEDIRREEPEAYELLRTIPVSLARRRLTVPEKCDPADYYLYHLDNVEQKPVIAYDEKEKHDYINLTNKHSGMEFSAFTDHATMKKYYDAYKLLQTKLDDKANQRSLILKEGVAVLMNNGRVSHGRNPVHQSSKRELLLGFLSEALWNSRWRILNGQKSDLEEKWLYSCSNQVLDILKDRKEVTTKGNESTKRSQIKAQ